MCLAVPGRIIRIDRDTAIVDYGGQRRKGKMLEGCYGIGDYVLIQGGLIMMKVDKEEAEEALRLYQEALSRL